MSVRAWCGPRCSGCAEVSLLGWLHGAVGGRGVVEIKNSYGNSTSRGRQVWIDFSMSTYNDFPLPWFHLELQKKTSRCQNGSTVHYRDWGRF